MADLSAIKLPNGTTYNLKDKGALPLTGGAVTGPVSFGDSVSIDDATVGSLVVDGSASFTNNIQANTINGVTVGSNPKFTDTNTVTTATTTGSGNAVTAVTASNGALTITKGATFLTSHQDISGKADKSATVSTVAYDSTNKKITKTINGTTTDVVTVATLKTALGSMPASDVYSWAKASSKPTYTASEVGAAAASHAHGNITSGGDITATAPTIASGDQLIINDHSASKVTNGPTFDGSTTTTALTPKGTWESFSKFSGSYNDLTNKPTIPSAASLLDIFYPVGTIYQTTLDPETFNPNTAWGGEWERIEGRFLVGKGTSTTDTSASDRLVIGVNDTTGGYTSPQNSKHSHGAGTLSTSEKDLSHTHSLASHTHTPSNTNLSFVGNSSDSAVNILVAATSGATHKVDGPGTAHSFSHNAKTSGPSSNTSGAMSGNSKHTHTISGSTAEVSAVSAGNLPPWYAVYIWQRMA